MACLIIVPYLLFVVVVILLIGVLNES